MQLNSVQCSANWEEKRAITRATVPVVASSGKSSVLSPVIARSKLQVVGKVVFSVHAVTLCTVQYTLSLEWTSSVHCSGRAVCTAVDEYCRV